MAGVIMNGIPGNLTLEDARDAKVIIGIEKGTIKILPLTQGKIALVDSEDYEWLSQWKWYASQRGYTYYALRSSWFNKYPHPVFMHREIMNLKKGDGTICDHRNRNGLHNYKENLRIVSHSTSMCNRKRNRNNTSGYKGVSWNKNAQKWIVHIGINGKDKYCGLFVDIETAAIKYDLEAIKYFGNDAVLNFPEQADFASLPCRG